MTLKTTALTSLLAFAGACFGATPNNTTVTFTRSTQTQNGEGLFLFAKKALTSGSANIAPGIYVPSSHGPLMLKYAGDNAVRSPGAYFGIQANSGGPTAPATTTSAPYYSVSVSCGHGSWTATNNSSVTEVFAAVVTNGSTCPSQGDFSYSTGSNVSPNGTSSGGGSSGFTTCVYAVPAGGTKTSTPDSAIASCVIL